MDVARLLRSQTGLVWLDDEDVFASLLQRCGNDRGSDGFAGIGVSSGNDDDSVEIDNVHDSFR